MTPRPQTTAALFFTTLTGCCLLAFSGTAQTPAPAAGAPQGAAGRGGGIVQDLTGR